MSYLVNSVRSQKDQSRLGSWIDNDLLNLAGHQHVVVEFGPEISGKKIDFTHLQNPITTNNKNLISSP